MIVRTGLGDTSATVASTVPTLFGAAAGAGESIAVGSGIIGANATAGTFAASSLAVPLIGVAIAGVTLVIGMWLSSIAKHNSEKTAATKIVDEAEPFMKQNVNAFMGLSNPTQQEKDQALANFDNIWAQVVKACSNANLEDAGKRCISDRSPGGATNWFGYYRDPIANTTIAPVSVLTSASNEASALFGGVNPLYIGVGLLALFLVGESS